MFSVSIKMPNPRKVLIVLVIFYAVGIYGLTFSPIKNHIEILSPYTLLMNLVLLFLYHKPWSSRHVTLFLFTAITGLIVEVAGVHTGLVFGDYQYGDVLGIKLFNTPLIIGINWLMLIYFVYHLTELSQMKLWAKLIAGSLLMVVYDLALEPVAIRMNMWNWPDGEIPVQNYFAWFIISFVFLSMFHVFKIRVKNKLSPGLFSVQAGFIIILNIIYRFI